MQVEMVKIYRIWMCVLVSSVGAGEWAECSLRESRFFSLQSGLFVSSQCHEHMNTGGIHNLCIHKQIPTNKK